MNFLFYANSNNCIKRLNESLGAAVYEHRHGIQKLYSSDDITVEVRCLTFRFICPCFDVKV